MKLQQDMGSGEIRTVYLGAFTINALVDYRTIGMEGIKESSSLPSGFFHTESPEKKPSEGPLYIGEHRIGADKRDVTQPILDVSLRSEFTSRFLLSPLGTGLVIVESSSTYDLKFEQFITDSLAHPIQTISDWVIKAKPELIAGERSRNLLPGAQLLWWHRLVPAGDAVKVKADSWGARTIKSQENLELTVGDGFTWMTEELLRGQESRHRVVRGLLAATDDWLVADTANKQLRQHVESLDKAIKGAHYLEIQRLNQEGETLTQQGQFLRLFMDERDRNLVVLEGQVWSCAREAWGLVGELSDLDTKISLIHNQASLATNRLQQSRDSFRNGVLFAIALLTALQGLIFVLDFAVNPAIEVRHPLRGIISLSLLIASLGVCVEIARRWLVERRTLRKSRRK